MTYLVTAAEVVTYAFNDKNFLSAKILDSHLEVAHEAFIRPALGDTFYEELIAATPTGANKTFVDTYLKKPIAWYVRYVILPEIMVHVSNTGLGIVQPAGMIAATDKQAGIIRDQAKANGDSLLRKALKYLDDNYTLFPNYYPTEAVRETTRIIGGIIF